jgi:hypothetical protein
LVNEKDRLECFKARDLPASALGDHQLIALIAEIVELGGAVSISAIDPLNPLIGVQVKAEWPISGGEAIKRSSAQDTRTALQQALAKS